MYILSQNKDRLVDIAGTAISARLIKTTAANGDTESNVYVYSESNTCESDRHFILGKYGDIGTARAVLADIFKGIEEGLLTYQMPDEKWVTEYLSH